ncbi:carbamoyltransferase HypF [Anaeromicropila herbilytica]|uniref:Carbamoyltransferase n=1 Tax=Anaeromicropila herbilytica TaxID=2785025 RepID=A0A7R7ELT8_9FIRM|nr:carbamoyltransferase HypF [Anaeromicropila herbilytica]BCN31245.1 carbamoyltransferase [Anaeromicropila herbilytica]
MRIRRYCIKVYGIVQGVGYRPFVYKAALKYKISGFVRNLGGMVLIIYEGDIENRKDFLYEVLHQCPPLASIEKTDILLNNIQIIVDKKVRLVRNIYNQKEAFVIMESAVNDNKIRFIPPDIAICKKCQSDMKDKNHRYYRYPFTNCTECGPRYSIIKSLPYDRSTTTMNEFKMCMECQKDYENIKSRRFHAEPTSCNQCGPRLWMTDKYGNELICEDVIKEGIRKLKEGKILAIKGIGGFHLACDALNDDAIHNLRDRKHRPRKPFAIMVRNIEVVKQICEMNEKEEEILMSERRPIVILKKKRQSQSLRLPDTIAPGSKSLGVMLPYAPIHYLLLEELDYLIMTSANISSMPLEYRNISAIKHLKDVADYFILHNRNIYIPIDDSVVKVLDGTEIVSRRARGYIPYTYKIQTKEEILAFGADMKGSICVSNNEYLYYSQYLGDLCEVECYRNYKKILNHFKTIFQIKPKIVTYDMHPAYISRSLAEEYETRWNTKAIGIYHHHAHMASCMGEHGLDEKVIGVIYDGTGYGTDGAIWGGEFLVGDYKSFHRMGHLDYLVIQGGEEAINNPWRILVCYLEQLGFDAMKLVRNASEDSIELLIQLLNSNLMCHTTSSMGRLFDAVSALLGICYQNTYEGQAAIELENELDEMDICIYLEEIKINKNRNMDYQKNQNNRYSYQKQYNQNDEQLIYPFEIIWKDGTYLIKLEKIFEGIIQDIEKGEINSRISFRFHNTVIEASAQMIDKISEITGIRTVILSGGVFENRYLLTMLNNKLKIKGYQVYYNQQIPTNDSGISYGQIFIANAKFDEREGN